MHVYWKVIISKEYKRVKNKKSVCDVCMYVSFFFFCCFSNGLGLIAESYV